MQSTATSRNWGSKPFESEKWLAAPAEERYIFVRSILEKNMFIGESREYVIKTLGQPDGNVTEYLSYIVKEFDPETCLYGFISLLHFDIDKKGFVTKVFVRAD